ncbi:ShlB/FhaC/HecB family hemolysin secretion/activation protein [Pseudomonas sp. 1912-s]|uniref:ShlB/FhaC/HecB family hemolysin secretion/activation protein n=1 Tax=Pseudomonas sp. 1912-s TaxID=3033802 RepID=UPI0023DF99BC|nr:ShlB/FhaC/HecB family hemolysin secretion/activation protein [Pseudomonas sp. 1912-s]MDF3200353.1 ShlB/FhaC/HecB family hemolysin secretion/activation protein [Pseudomonas sp. 1912-s]
MYSRHCNIPCQIRASWMLTALAIVLIAPAPTLAADPRAQELERRTREQLELEQRLRLLERSGPLPPQAAPGPPPPLPVEPCWQVRGLRLQGNTLISLAQVNARLQPLMSDCMSVTRINQLLGALTALYADAGFIASRPYLAQRPQDGQSLDIIIEEGFVESIELAAPDLPISLRGAFPGMLGKPLQLRELEQGLDQLNRLRSLDLTADVAPGSLPGGSRLLIRPRTSAAPIGAVVSYNNRGTEYIGRNNGALTLTYDSPSGLNDFVALSTSTTLDQTFAYSRSQSLYYNIPYGFWTLALSASHSQYRYPVELPSQTVRANGQTRQYSLSLNRLLWRDQGTLLNGMLRLSSKRSQSYFADQYLAIQSPSLTVAEASLSLLKITDGLWNTTLSYAQGLDWLGADRDEERLSPALPRAQFRKYRADVSYWRQGRDGQWSWNSQLALQYSPDPLPSLEQMLLTDDYAVRGFRQDLVQAANGAVWRNTLSLPRRLGTQWTLSPRVGLDVGWSKQVTGAESQRLAGANIGVGLSTRDWQLDLDYQRRLYGPPPSSHEPGFWRLELSLQI